MQALDRRGRGWGGVGEEHTLGNVLVVGMGSSDILRGKGYSDMF